MDSRTITGEGKMTITQALIVLRDFKTVLDRREVEGVSMIAGMSATSISKSIDIIIKLYPGELK